MQLNFVNALLRPRAHLGLRTSRTFSTVSVNFPRRTVPKSCLASEVTSSPLRDSWFYRRCYSVVAQRKPAILHSLEPRFFSANAFHAAARASQLPVVAPPAVGRWLLFSSVMVFAVIVVGGVTRLTESGLSITEWKPITGIIPPMNVEDWSAEFEKYKATPEFKL
ncbi:cytochrome oxidase assembly protein-domain-containing protein [Suillus lakei]|nr:cytochrome oxidase assembly protein-domain-containing protein [Suillus lakei]